MILTNYFLNREIRKLRNTAAKRPHQYLSLDKIKDILLVCDSKDWDIVRICVEKFKSMRKNVNTAIYAPTEKDVPTWYSNYLLLRSDKDVNLWGIPNVSTQKQFFNLKADMLINFSKENSLAMLYLVLKHSAMFKVGIKESENSIYDFSIIPPKGKNDITFLFDNLLKYLTEITAK